MLYLISLAITGIAIAYFATQNTQTVDLNWAGYILPNVPIYLVMLGSLLVGFVLAGIVGIVNMVSSFFTHRSYRTSIRGRESEVKQLSEEVRSLKAENSRLKERSRPSLFPKRSESLSEKVRHGLSL